VQGHIGGSLVRRQAAEKLVTAVVQPVAEGSSPRRGRKERHQIKREPTKSSVVFPENYFYSADRNLATFFQ
jgi:hypothetical protein